MTKHTQDLDNDAQAVVQRVRYFLDSRELAGAGSTLSTVQDGPGTHAAMTVQDLRELVTLATASGTCGQTPTESASPRQQVPMTPQTQALLQRALTEIEYLHKSIMQAAGCTSSDGRDNSVAVDLRAALTPATTVRRARAKPAERQPGAFVRDWTAAIRSMPGGAAAGELGTRDGAPTDKA